MILRYWPILQRYRYDVGISHKNKLQRIHDHREQPGPAPQVRPETDQGIVEWGYDGGVEDQRSGGSERRYFYQ